ncbi:beta strand repeat-containing protein [Hyphobacterium marinum]|uniref:Ig-like domain-containing protein n=1 Tax=Hyphobacterium marinum TaxID=3116574 RepID=A0ABU7LUE3_9PROT|nr:Ig-like domain-containing protein [Hyphobacterium sp. Y6023]MEE2565182.1 Ig-like domain-containing protein [Hyphobacterium sp. Y6023]
MFHLFARVTRISTGRLIGSLTLAVGLALSAPALAAPPVANDDAFVSNTSSAPMAGSELVLRPADSNLRYPEFDLAPTSDGGFFLVLEKYRGGYLAGIDNTDIVGQFYAGDGSSQSSELAISPASENNHPASDPAVSLRDDGGFATAWSRFIYCGANCYTGDLRTLQFSANAGIASTTARADDDTPGIGGYPDVAALAGGGHVVVWHDRGSGERVHARVFDNNGVAAGASVQVADGVEFGVRPRVVGLPSGGFVVTWSQDLASGADTDGTAVLARQYDANAAPVGAAFLVNSETQLDQSLPAITVLGDGGFVIAWTHVVPIDGGPFGQADIRAQRYDSAGSPVGTEFTVNVATATQQIDVDLAPLSNGGFVASWSSNGTTTDDPDGYGVRARVFDAAGAGSAELAVNATTAGDQGRSRVAPLAGNGFVVAFRSSEGATSQILARVFTYPPIPASTSSPLPVLANDTDADGDPLTITAVNGTAISADADFSGAGPITGPLAGPVTLPSGAVVSLGSDLTYDPTAAPFAIALPGGTTGSDNFTYTISDGSLTDTANVTVTVTGVNDAPSADNDTLSVGEDAAAANVTATLLDGDTDPDTGETAQLAVTAINTTGTQGQAVFNAGTVTYGPNGAFEGLAQGQSTTDVFTYTVSDPGGLSAVGTMTVTVNGANDAPVPGDVFGTVSEDSVPADITAAVLGGVADPDSGDTHTITAFDATGTQGSVALAAGQLTYDPRGAFDNLNDGQSQLDTFTFTVTDANGASGTATARITVTGLSDVLTVSTSGLGTGQVTSAPGGITCGDGGNDCSEEYDAGLSVVLTATPAAGSVFDQWTSGPCTGQSGTCQVDLGGDVSADARFELASPPDGRIVAATLPGARSGYVGGPDITAFLSVVSRATTPAQDCRVTAPGTPPFAFSYRMLDGSNQPTGPADPRFDLTNGQTLSFILAMTPQTATGDGGYVFQPAIVCDNATLAPIDGVNSVLLSIGAAPVPDILSIAATQSGDGVIRVPASGNRVGILSAAAINIGAGDGVSGPGAATITVFPDTGTASLPLTVTVCETNSIGVCLAPRSASVTSVIASEAKLFAVFVRVDEGASIPFDPANARVFLRFRSEDNVIRSVTSAAVTSPAPSSDIAETVLAGRWSILVRQDTGDWPSLERGSLHVLGNGRAVLASGGMARLIDVTAQPGPDGTVVFTTGGAAGVALLSGTIRLGDALADQPGTFWGVRDDRSTTESDWSGLAGSYDGITVASDGTIAGSYLGCSATGSATRSPDGAAGLRTGGVSLSGCALQGRYTAILDPAANDQESPALILANGDRGWRVTR